MVSTQGPPRAAQGPLLQIQNQPRNLTASSQDAPRSSKRSPRSLHEVLQRYPEHPKDAPKRANIIRSSRLFNAYKYDQSRSKDLTMTPKGRPKPGTARTRNTSQEAQSLLRHVPNVSRARTCCKKTTLKQSWTSSGS